MRFHKEFLLRHRGWMMPTIVLGLLVVALFVTFLVSQQKQDLRSKAATSTASLAFAQTAYSTSPGSLLSVPIALSTGSQPIVSADIVVEFDKTKLTLQSLSKPDHAIFKTYSPTVGGVFDTAKIISNANSTGQVRFSLNAFDSAASTTMAPFSGTINPVSTLAFVVNSTATTGQTSLTFKYEMSSATSDSNILSVSGTSVSDILQPPTSVALVTISSPVLPSPTVAPSLKPSPLPTPSPTATPVVSPKPSTTPLPSGDFIPPTVSVTNPQNNTLVRRNREVILTAQANDNNGILKVQFFVNGTHLCSELTAPYECSWKVPSKRNASYSIVARAYDTSNNATSSLPITVKSTWW